MAPLLAALIALDTGLSAPFLAQSDGKPIALNIGHSAPILTDFDNDGLKDLLVGEFGGGGIRFYKNVGTAETPRFGKHEMVRAGGKPIAVEAG